MIQFDFLDGVICALQLGTAVYALRLNRIFGTNRAGWALFGAFALMTAMHLNSALNISDALSVFDF